VQVVGKEKYFKNPEHDKKFNKDNDPKSSAKRHAPKAVNIKGDNSFYQSWQFDLVSFKKKRS
jgi:hypothetical protein